MSIAPEAPSVSALQVEFSGATAGVRGPDGRHGIRVPLTRLAGAETECLFRTARATGEEAGFRLFAADDLTIGWSSQAIRGGIEAAAAELYRRLLTAIGDRSLCRIWNYVPAINQARAGTENYFAFNEGRARAFAGRFGADYVRHLPAASAVGCGGGDLIAIFVAAARPPRHFENPEQTPAYRYPTEHGPFSPSFARATLTAWAGRPVAFVSGTSAIKGHATVAPGSLAGQVDCTIDNLRLISRATGWGDDLGAAADGERHFKVYLRHAADLRAAQRRLSAALFRPGDRVVWLEADICRADLNVEIEATLFAAAQ